MPVSTLLSLFWQVMIWQQVPGRTFLPTIFFGTRGGSLHYIDDLGNASEAQTLGARVDHLLFFEKKSRLIVLTRAHVLAQLKIGGDGKVVTVMKMKVAVAGGSAAERGIKNVCWVGPEVLAAATGEVITKLVSLSIEVPYRH